MSELNYFQEFLQKIAIWIIPVLFAITLHEVAHGWVAYLLGDRTAKMSGRLSLNPLNHIDPIGTVVVPLVFLAIGNFLFGWAKPVPVDARNFKHPRRDMAFVAAAGPFANFIMAFMFALIIRLAVVVHGVHSLSMFAIPLALIGKAGVMINIILFVLNLLPLPPLDGGNVLMAILPPRYAYAVAKIEPYSLLILIALIFSGGFSYIMGPPVQYLLIMFSYAAGGSILGIE